MVLYLLARWLLGSRWWWLGFLHTFAFWLFLPLIVITGLVLLFQGKQTARRSFFLFILGMGLFAPLPIGWLTTSDEPHDLRVMTYNMLGNNGRIVQTVDWILEQNADVLILQEFVGGNLEWQLPRLLEIYPHRVHVVGNVQIFSRLPILEGETIYLQDPEPARDGRLAVRAVIDVNDQPVTVYGVHLSVPFSEQPHGRVLIDRGLLGFILHYDETERNHQWQTLTEMVASETNPVIVGGDFNTSHTSPILGRFTDVGMTDAFKAVGTGWGMTWSHNPPFLPLLRLDYLWSSEQLTPLRYSLGDFIGAEGSDHLPVVVDYRLG